MICLKQSYTLPRTSSSLKAGKNGSEGSKGGWYWTAAVRDTAASAKHNAATNAHRYLDEHHLVTSYSHTTWYPNPLRPRNYETFLPTPSTLASPLPFPTVTHTALSRPPTSANPSHRISLFPIQPSPPFRAHTPTTSRTNRTFATSSFAAITALKSLSSHRPASKTLRG